MGSLLKTLVASLIVVGVHSTLACAADLPEADLSQVTLNIGQNNGELEPLWRRSGVFADTPYKIEFSSFQNTLDNLTALAAGNIDVSSNSLNSALQLEQSSDVPWTSETAPVKVVIVRLNNYSGSPEPFVVMAASNSGITKLSAETVRGKRFAFSPGGINYLVYLATIKSLGLTPKDVEPIELNTTANALALLNNSVDLVSGTVELYGAALENGAKIVGASSKLGLVLQSGILANTKALSDPSKSAAISDFLARYVKYENWFNTHPKEAEAAYVEGRHFTEMQAQTAWLYGRVLLKKVDADTAHGLEGVTDLLIEAGKFQRKDDVTALLDDRYTKTITDQLQNSDFEKNLYSSVAAAKP